MAAPFLLDSDRLQLAGDFVFQPTKAGLLDTTFGARHSIAPHALPLLQGLQTGISVAQWQAIARQQNITQTEQDSLLSALNLCGALRRKRAVVIIGQAWLEQFKHQLFGVRYSPLVHRSGHALGNLLVTCLIACLPLLVVLAALDSLIVASHVFRSGIVFIDSGLSFATLLISVYIHELTHALVVIWYGHPLVIIRRGIRPGLLHGQLAHNVELLSAVAGPGAGTIFCFGLGVVFWCAGVAVLSLISVVIGFIQACSLLPRYADGAAVRQALQRTGT